MAVTAATKSVKLRLVLAEGTQTIAGCNVSATNENLFSLGNAVSKIEAQAVDSIIKVKESTLIVE